MGNCTITIHATGAHHNHGQPADINRMAMKFADDLKAAGHLVEDASITHGAREDLTPDRPSTSATRAGYYDAAKVAGIALLAAVLLWHSPARAADMNYPTKAPAAVTGYVPWYGLYVSGYGLYGANITNTTVDFGTTTAADLASTPHGPGIGGSIGYNFQPNPGGVVLGIRADLAYANLQGGGQALGSVSVSNATNYLGDLDALVGLSLSADGRLLGYVVGGFAFGGAKPNLQVATFSAAASDTSTGYNFGAGLAFALTPNWQLFIEGDYFQLGDKSLTASDPASGAPIATSLTKYHMVTQKAGVIWKF